MRHQTLAPLLVLGLWASACNCTTPPPSTTKSLTPVGEKCLKDEECVTGLCAALTDEGPLCRATCGDGCQPLEICTTFGVAKGGKARVGCVPERAGLCQPCTQHSDCPYPADLCLSIGGAKVCGRDCSSDGKCPEGYACTDGIDIDGAPASHQCQPKAGSCDCVAANAGRTRPCEVKNGFGTCTGKETCDAKLGFVRCDARVPTVEVCNGQDDNCNGKVDDGLADLSCGVGECTSVVAACKENAPNTCTPLPPKTESCNGKDDNCDGKVDEPFDLLTDLAHCGKCNTACAVKNGTAACKAGTCAVGACDKGFDDCDHDYATGCEVDTRVELSHCGACGNKCKLPNAVPGCTGGACVIVSCLPGFQDLNQKALDGCEYGCLPTNGGVEKCDGIDNNCDGKTDETFECTARNGAAACVRGLCVITSCDRGFGDCDQLYASGCETNTEVTAAHCGACNKACALAHASTQCLGGTCLVKSCDAGFENCDGVHPNGCEVDTRSDPRHCGQCGNLCSVGNGTPGCVGGSCTVASCKPPFADCDLTYTTGCEVNKDTDQGNCGKCGNLCPTRPNASPRCFVGSCGFTCTEPFQDCDGKVIDGCESNKATDVEHCGDCGTPCPARDNASRTCAAGACGYTCLGSYGDCNGLAQDGCETDKTKSLAHCGSCNNPCPYRPSSARTCNGTCGYSCTSPHQDCNGQAADGCESDTARDLAHCGACNNACPERPNSSRTCSGTCGYVCKYPFQDCNGVSTDGCESNRWTDAGHCGSCQTSCPTPANAIRKCSSGSCGIGCSTGFANCDGTDSNGCERRLDTAAPAPQCGAVTDLGSIRGDAGSPGDKVSRTGFGEGTFKVRVKEANSSIFCAYLSTTILLTSPSGIDYDLWVYTNGCGRSTTQATTAGEGGTEGVGVCACEGCIGGFASGSDDYFDVWFEVVYKSGSACGTWSVSAAGNTTVDLCANGC